VLNGERSCTPMYIAEVTTRAHDMPVTVICNEVNWSGSFHDSNSE
jgi:hypothetical protein